MRKKMDLDQWVRYKQHGRASEVQWPIKLMDGTLVAKPKTMHEKKRHWFIWGKPDIGKTTWVQTQFAGQKVFCRAPDGDAPFDDYDGEEVIIYDDVNIENLRSELIATSNVYSINTKVPGRTRYTTRYWPLEQLRTIIILGNDKPSFYLDGWWESRFNMLDLTNWEPTERLLAPLMGEPQWSPVVGGHWDNTQSEDQLQDAAALVDALRVPETPPREIVPASTILAQLQAMNKEAAEKPPARGKNKHPKAIASDDEYEYAELQDPYA